MSYNTLAKLRNSLKSLKDMVLVYDKKRGKDDTYMVTVEELLSNVELPESRPFVDVFISSIRESVVAVTSLNHYQTIPSDSVTRYHKWAFECDNDLPRPPEADILNGWFTQYDFGPLARGFMYEGPTVTVDANFVVHLQNVTPLDANVLYVSILRPGSDGFSDYLEVVGSSKSEFATRCVNGSGLYVGSRRLTIQSGDILAVCHQKGGNALLALPNWSYAASYTLRITEVRE